MKRLEQKVAIVTGSARGIGRGIVEKFVSEGARVVVADILEDAARETAEALKARGAEAIAVPVDVTSKESVDEMVEQTVRHFSRVDILVNNAGWDKVEPFIDNDVAVWDRIIRINLYGTLFGCKAVLPHMIEQGYGKIVNIGSDAGRVGSTGEAVYSATKGGVIAFTKTLAREMARHHINVNCVSPGPADTPLFAEVGSYNPKIRDALIRAIPFRRLALPEDLANAVAFLASDEAAYITGQTLSVSGGLTMC
ncbi:SDR family NAD(P)-dependent oxidoreductase [Kyrpidia spormannii]|uniref:3-oxoacyl-[acyl-carrier-protein] reductase FabG n=1 Tax=Kyrpidia spormannii TaxID=2055160 RepID=A0ACA8ZBI8_9BACL|nr:3-oxoacyl-ACP reductase family protein [Kyrpidia spormannii]CAB3393983.1 3-oxoacyl-[acyl-carrier-protein] reductase FabG [Kyrpidia spormannii]